ncbi:pyruvate dehydrogenase E1 subunit alpha [Desulfosarcina ovata subsp. sediminis]|uniref:Pyruvate dehydrogenase E1 subunit alpha n=2 Tax=Desulfosarcina ovata TaxID=83564 RepID=A0A5K7ZJ70_9BACT|nr:pyruvate dehydrogenase E1 subunit alpha [Desulfosarcina ovata subsp. sediminis]
MHMSIGEEAIVAGVVKALTPHDQVLGTYRSHALYLAKTRETNHFFAEMFGKADGCARGKAGSMHLSAPDKGLLCCSAIVGGSIPVAMGAAFANKYKNNGKCVAVFFGDGAMEEGVFWETINFCGLKRLPILFICEDNGLAIHTSRETRQVFNDDEKLFGSFGIKTFEENTSDPEIVYSTTKKALNHLRSTNSPCFLRFHYYRCLEHVGVNEDFDAGYRSRQPFIAWQAKDPLVIQKEKLLNTGVHPDAICKMEDKINKQIEDSIRFAKDAPFPDTTEAYNGVFSCV